MLSDRRVATMVPASDWDRAKNWYEDTLGLKRGLENPGGTQYTCADGTEFWVYPSQFAGTNRATVMGFYTTDIKADMEDLKSRGVTFEEYDILGVKTEDGIAELVEGERAAWFKDSEGNILALFESATYNR